MSTPNNTPQESKRQVETRASLITAVTTPLGFFVLAVLIVEAILGIIVGTLTGDERMYFVALMFGILIFVILVVALIAAFRPMSLYGKPTPARDKQALQIQYSEANLKVEKVIQSAERQVNCANETIRVFSALFPKAPNGIEPQEWQIITGLIRDQTHYASSLLQESRVLERHLHTLYSNSNTRSTARSRTQNKSR